LYPA
jgi:hypothetical protein